MSIKSEVTTAVIPSAPKFPCIRVNIKKGETGCEGTVVLFTSGNSGVVIHSTETCFPVGTITNTWIHCDDVTQWQPCTITLTTET